MLLAGWEVRIGKNCDRGLENAAQGRRLRAAFSSPRSQFFTIQTDPKLDNNMFIRFSCGKLAYKSVGLFTQICHWIGLRAVCKPFVKNLTSERASIYYTKKDVHVLKNRFFSSYFMLVAFSLPVKFSKSIFFQCEISCKVWSCTTKTISVSRSLRITRNQTYLP